MECVYTVAISSRLVRFTRPPIGLYPSIGDFFSALFLLLVMKRHLNKRQMPSMGQFLLCFYGNSNSVRFSLQKKHARTNKTPNGNDCFRCIERRCEYVRNHIDICAYEVEIGKPPKDSERPGSM